MTHNEDVRDTSIDQYTYQLESINTSQHSLVKVRSDLGLVRVSKQLIAITMNFELTFYCFLWIVPSSNYAIISFQFDLVFKNFLYIFIYFISFLV